MNENADIPPVLYHYCGVEGFHGILTSKQIWLSDVHFMNDTTEQTQLIDVATRVLQELLPGPENVFIQLLIQNFEWMRLTPYACCFCEDGNLLSQWCRYADNCEGFAVGFSSAWLREQSRKYLPKHPLTLLEVEYDDDRQRSLVTSCIDEYLKKVRGLTREGRQDVSMRTNTTLWVLSAACKHHSFHEEREVRLIAVEITHPESEVEAIRKTVGISPMCHRLRGTQNVPYLQLGFSEEAVAEIHLGPMNREREDRSNLEMFLKNNGYDLHHIRIVPSLLSGYKSNSINWLEHEVFWF